MGLFAKPRFNLILLLLFFFSLLALPKTAAADSYTWTDQSALGAQNWESIRSSSDGSHLIAAVNGGDVYTSLDHGTTWVDATSAGTRNWRAVAINSDGTRLAVAEDGGDIYTSTDFGATWVDRAAAGSRSWHAITIDRTGSILFGMVYGGDIYKSTDGGATWQRTTGTGRNWVSMAMSDDATHLVAVEAGGLLGTNFYRSSDSGNTWTGSSMGIGSGPWEEVSMSSDGTHIALAAFQSSGLFSSGSSPGELFTSTNFGSTWQQSTSAGVRNWGTVSVSPDGTHILAAEMGGDIYLSSDFGATWVDQQSAGSDSWFSSTLSSNGSRAAAISFGGDLHSGLLVVPPSPPTPVQRSSISAASPTDLIAGNAAQINVSGAFVEPIAAIQINNTSLPSSSWGETPSLLQIQFPAKSAGTYSIQIFNGSIPLLTPIIVTVSDPLPVVAPQPPPAPTTPPTPTPTTSASLGGQGASIQVSTPTVSPSKSPTPTPSETLTPTPSLTASPTTVPTLAQSASPTATPIPTPKSPQQTFSKLKTAVYFSYGSTTLDKKSEKKLFQLIKSLKGKKIVQITLEGRSSGQNSKANTHASLLRAEGVQKIFKRSLPGVKYVIRALGASSPSPKGKSPQALALNRRVDITVLSRNSQNK